MAETRSSPSKKLTVSRSPAGSALIEPLTRDAYKRLSKTEQQIADAITLTPAQLIERAQCREKTAPEFLTEEVLIYFIRRAVICGDRVVRDALFRELLERCTRYFRGKFRGFNDETREDMQGDVMAKVTEDLLAPDDRGDFMQVRFWTYLERRVVDACRKAKQHSDNYESLDEGYSGETKSEGPTRFEHLADERLSPEQLLMIEDALSKLPPDLRKVFWLYHYVGMKIGGDNSKNDSENEFTIAKHCGRTGRTIRDWLRKAERLLTSLVEDYHGE